jgi:predicted molibdopterin-dependent oxidoreductase YjgC
LATIKINDQTVDAPDGATLLEVCKDNGAYVSSLCYIDGLPPYAGCRMCLVEVEGARGLQLSCTTKIADGMAVRTDTPEVLDARRQVLSLILANHSDRCLTCHRREKCHPGDICLRDDVVTHRCITCSKNYRCELQATCEVVGSAEYEPWVGESRTYYQAEQPLPDRANPYLEFDPQMCIICTRCVRACDELRHTGAVTLAGKGFTTMIAFGAGGAIHDSNCDFCGACIDVCPTATLMEHPHKWVAKPDTWTTTVCQGCSVGCTIRLGTKDGKGVIVRPEPSNSFSRDQICVRGRFHYDSLKDRERLQKALVRRGEVQAPIAYEEAVELAAQRLSEIVAASGPASVGVLVGPTASNEAAYLAQKLARAVLGTNNVDSSLGPIQRAISDSLKAAFGTDILPANLDHLPEASTVVLVEEDLESTNNIAALRAKDAVVRNGAKLIRIATRYGETADFADVWLRPEPGRDFETVQSLVDALSAELSDGDDSALESAAALLRAADPEKTFIVYAPNALSAKQVRATSAAVCNLAVAVLKERAAERLGVLPAKGNLNGLRDMGASPGSLPGEKAALEQAWGTALPETDGLDVWGMLEGGARAVVLCADNPIFRMPDRARVTRALEGLDFLLVLDDVLSDEAKLAHLVVPVTGHYGEDGTITQADRRIIRRRAATAPVGDQRPLWQALTDLGERLNARQGRTVSGYPYGSAAEVMAEISALSPLYGKATYRAVGNAARQEIDAPPAANAQPVPVYPNGHEGLSLLAIRDLYTAEDAAKIHHKDADKLHRGEFVEIHPADAARLGVQDGSLVSVGANGASVSLNAQVTDQVPEGAVNIPLPWDGGAVTGLFEKDGGSAPEVTLTG